jgi:hypothetical protein
MSGRRAQGLSALVAVTIVLAGGFALARVDRSSDAGGGGDVSLPEATSGSSVPSDRWTCPDDVCEVWRAQSPRTETLVAADGIVIAVGSNDLAGYAAADGRPLWQRRLPAHERVQIGTAALSEAGLATIVAPPPGHPPAGVPGPRIVVHDHRDGMQRFVVDPELSTLSELAWIDGMLVVAGLSGVQGSETAVILAVDEDGEVAWRFEGRGFPILVDDPGRILVLGTEMVRIDVASGEVRWRVRGETWALDDFTGDRFAVLDRDAGSVKVLDADRGTLLLTIPASGA